MSADRQNVCVQVLTEYDAVRLYSTTLVLVLLMHDPIAPRTRPRTCHALNVFALVHTELNTR